MKDDRIDYVYLLAASHSGSTLLALLLNAHPDIISVGEISSGSARDLQEYRCSCRRPIRDCPFWIDVSATMFRSHPEFNLADFGVRLEPLAPPWVRRLTRLEHRGPAIEALRDAALALSPTWRRHFARTADCCTALARALIDQSGGRFVVDSSKLAHRLKFVRRMKGLRVRVVHLVRDGRAVALTYMDQQTFADAADPALRRGGRGQTSPRAEWEMPMSRAADEWRRCMVAAEHALAAMTPSEWIRITYEDLCADPEATLRRVFDFIGADPRRAVRDFRSVENHLVGNGMRFDATSEIKEDDRWRTALSAADLRTFEDVAGLCARRYGYCCP